MKAVATKAVFFTAFASFISAVVPYAATRQSPATTVFEGKATVPLAKGKTRNFHVRIRRWELDADDSAGRTIPITAFSVMTLCSGRIETTIDGNTSVREPEDFWAVKAGSIMKVRVLGESAILQGVIVTPLVNAVKSR